MVGADGEANDATGIEDNPHNSSAIDCDAVYMTSAGLMPNDEQVVAFLSLDDVTGYHTLRWEWIEPDSGIYLVSNEYSLVVKKGKYLPKVTAWHRLSINYEAAADTLGEWKVAVYVDDELVDVKPFMLNC